MLSVVGRIAWILIQPVVAKMAMSGASASSIYAAVQKIIQNLNYVGDTEDLRVIFEKVAQEIALHAGMIVNNIF